MKQVRDTSTALETGLNAGIGIGLGDLTIWCVSDNIC